MKKLLSAFIIVVCFKMVSFAQPTISFPSVTPCTEDNPSFCMGITVRDFTDILSMEYSIVWDPAVLRFDEVNNFGLPGLSAGNFDLSQTTEGIITLKWSFNECSPDAVGVTLNDDVAIFNLCFTALGTYGAATEVKIENQPVDIKVTRVNACPNNIGLFTEPGIVSTCVRPLTLKASREESNEGDLVCVDYSVEGFDNLTSMQFSINWDADILEFVSVNVLDNLENLSESGFGTPDDPDIPNGSLTVSWAFVDPNDNSGITLEDNTTIFQVCYRVKGDCETSSQISFSSSPTPIEVTNTIQEGFEISVYSDPGEVTIGDCDPTGLQLVANCGAPVELNQEICVEVTTAGFVDVQEMNFLMEWNPFILEFKEVRNTNPSVVGLGANDFKTENAANGVLGLDWKTIANIGQTLTDGEVLFEVCFVVTGLGGNSPVRFPSSPARVKTKNSNNIGIAPSNCEVQVIQPDGVTITIDDAEVPVGETVCVDLSVNNFQDILSTQFSMAWDTAHMTFVEIRSVNLPETNQSNFGLTGIDGGSLTFNWQPSRAYSLTEGQNIFSLCFEGTGEPKDCQLLEIVDLPIKTEVISTSSNGNNIGLTGQGGEICMLNPEGFTLAIGSDQGFLGDTICIPFKVADFADITSASFSVNWLPSALNFIEVRTSGELGLDPAQNFNTGSVGIGLLGFDWADAGGAALADSTVLFEVCFSLLGPVNECQNIGLDQNQTVTTLNGEGSIQLTQGSICINDQIIIESVNIKPVSCAGSDDGEVEIEVSGGTGQIFYNWGSTPTQFTNRARNLPVGDVTVTIFDSNNPALVRRETITVPLSDDLPVADAGPDQEASCDPDFFRIDGGGSQGPLYDYSWTTRGGLILSADQATLVARGAGLYILTVRNNENRCAATDTVQIFEPPVPEADAGLDFTFDCTADTLQLDGSRSSLADTVAYSWTALDGGAFVPGEDTLRSPRITQPGTFIMEVYYTTTKCSALDTVEVQDLRDFPDANAGEDVELSCTDDFVLLDGSGSINDGSVSYQWENPEGQLLSNGRSFQATQAGTYYLRVTDQTTSCEALDSVQVALSGEFPTVDAGEDQVITCLNDTVSVNGEVTNSPDFSFEWISRDGGGIVPGSEATLSPQITAPGIYDLVVTNLENQCVASDSIMVMESRIFPVAEAGPGAQLTCENSNFILDGTGSSVGDNYSYTWRLDGAVLALDTLKVEIGSVGTYYLEVSNRENGCNAVDSVVVSLDGSIPQITLDSVSTLNCIDNFVTLTANVSPPAGNYAVEWQTTDGNILNGNGTLSIQVDRPGAYQVVVRNLSNGCDDTAQAIVDSDEDTPVANAGPDQAITCLDSSVTLDGSASSTGDQFSYKWTEVDGSNPDEDETLQTVVASPGTYVLAVSNSLNGCSSRDTVIVSSNTAGPQVSISDPDLLSCTIASIQLNGSGSEFGPGYTAEWSGMSGQPVETTSDPLIASVSQAGFYQLLIRNENTGCESAASVEVQTDDSVPVADAGGDQILSCAGTPLTLSGVNSSSGADFTYLWTVVAGAGSVENATTNTATVTQPGTYQIEVTNTSNGCKSAATAIVTLDPVLVPANAGDDVSTCDNTAMLFAELPAGLTGQWTTATGAKVESPSDPSSFVEGLQDGNSRFVWTVSSPNCPGYSSDEVVVTKETAPVANPDNAEVPSGENQVQINVVGNDQLNTNGDWEVTIQSAPSLGVIQAINGGNVVYVPNPGVFGVDEFTYQLCNLTCSLCAEASVKVAVDFSQISAEDFPNAITPNGDGVNDELFFNVLDNAVDFWPDNQLIVFNRWGDIVYEAKPYANNWNGTTDNGQPLPDGTYYYILRLDISNGVIFKGDITILNGQAGQ